jgi:signal transduction histidine kinase
LSSDPVDVRLGGALAVERRGDVLLISGQNGSVLLDRRSNPFWWVVSAATQSGPYVIPGLLLVAIGILLLRLRRQRRFLDAMLEVPGAGLVFVFDAGGRLLRTNDRSARLLRITAKVPMRRLYRAYMRHNGVDGLQAFITHALDVRRPVSEKITVDDDDEQREYMFTAQPLWGTLGRMRALVVTGIDITEALERRRLVNWAQLAHDMQTNLSTIRLNGEQLTDLMQEADKQRVKRILFQTDVLIQRVRDLVGVGRSEDLQRSQVHSAEFCTQILHEFDAGMFPNVQFVMKLRGTMMNVDKLKLSRAVRNAVENAIKSLRGNQGTVEIATWFDRNNVYIRISDTGVGMDTLTLENMMKPYFTTAKEGSGTGIGTMIMQHVTHMHGGSLRVTSEPGEGTQVVFRIPIGL